MTHHDRNHEFSRWLLSSARAEDMKSQAATLVWWRYVDPNPRKAEARNVMKRKLAAEAAHWAAIIEKSDRFVYDRTFLRVLSGIETHQEWSAAYASFMRRCAEREFEDQSAAA